MMRVFIKIHKKKFIEDMYNNEYLYFSPLYGFRDKEEETGRLDPKEGNLKNKQIAYLAVGEGDDKIVLSEVLSNFNSQYHENLTDPKINCCSLYTQNLRVNKVPKNVDKRMYSMGNRALIIYDEKKFYELLDKAITEAGFKYSRGFVTYYDPTKYDGDLTLHHKNDEYNFQNEYRILIAPAENEGIKIPIDGLQEISVTIDSDNIENLRLIPNS